MAEPVTIDMFLDVSCSWCYGALSINRQLLDELHADSTIPPLRIRWRFLRLHPVPAPGGVPLDELYESYGMTPAAGRAEAKAFTDSVGVIVDYDRFTFLHDPFEAHRLLTIVRDDGGDDLPDLWAVARAIWSANFTHGDDITDPAVLRAAARRSGLELPERIWTQFADLDAGRAAVLADHAFATSIQLDGVPRIAIGGTIVPTWIDRDDVRAQLRAAISSAAAPTAR